MDGTRNERSDLNMMKIFEIFILCDYYLKIFVFNHTKCHSKYGSENVFIQIQSENRENIVWCTNN